MDSQITFLDTGVVCSISHRKGVFRIDVYNNMKDAELTRYEKFKEKIKELCN